MYYIFYIVSGEITMSAVRNGVDVGALTAAASAIKADPKKAKFEFHSETKWSGGARSRTTIKDFVIESDEPVELFGSNTAPNAVSIVLAALGSCLTVGFAYSAAVRGVNLESLELDIGGDLDLRGFMGVSDEVRPGYQNIHVTCRLKSDASREKIDELLKYVQDTSPVTDIIRNPVPVTISLEESG
jgi:uncharacterized OsmC-like protein